MDPPYLEDTPTGCKLRLYAQPKASKTAFAGLRAGALKVWVDAPPVDGKANERLCRFVARACAVSPSHVSVARGGNSRHKLLLVKGAHASEHLRRKLRDVGIPGPGEAPP